MEETSKQFKQTKLILETREFDFPQLKNFHNNISNFPDLSDYEREELIKIVTEIIHTKFPKRAKGIFGGKSEKAKALLIPICDQLKEEFDWSKNKIGSYVKVGGDMIAGRQHVCWYISYKNENGINVGFVYRQLTATDEPFIEVYKRQVGKVKEIEDEKKNFYLEQKDEALELYKSYLINVII